MAAHFKVTTVPHRSGVHRPMLVSAADGIPLPDPTYYLTSMHVCRKVATNTQRKILESIMFLLEWSLLRRVDISKRFAEGDFLSTSEIDSLCQDASYDLRHYQKDPFLWGEKKRRNSSARKRYKPVSQYKIKDLVKDTTKAQRLFYICEYVDWLALEAISRLNRSPEILTARDTARTNMVEAIKARIPEISETSQAPEGLDPDIRIRILEVIHPDHPENPFTSEHVKARNRLLILFLDALGLRRSEALLIKLSDLDLNSDRREVNICAHDNDPQDSRSLRPEFKTRERPLSLSPDLVRLTKEYIRNFRGTLGLSVRKHGYLFVDTRNGAPLSLSSADDIYRTLRSKVSGLPRDLSFHDFRYTWSDRFCARAAAEIKAGEWTEDRAKKIHADWCGWSPRSKMPEKYAKRYIREKANEIGLKMQADLYLSTSDPA